MPVLLRAEGPSLNRELLLQEGAAAVTVGRDPAAGLHLPDPERALSRKHLSIAALGAGVQVTVLSSVNGAVTSQGELAPGQSARLSPGERVSLGPYTIHIEAAGGRSAGVAHGAMPAPAADDPFASLFGGAGGSAAAGADPFAALGVAPSAPARAPVVDPFAALAPPAPGAGAPARPGLGGDLHAFGHNLAHPASGPQAHADDPLALLGGVGTGSASRDAVGGGTLNIDDWLGAGSASDPPPAQGPGRLATDHVHDLNLPLRLPQGAAPPAAAGWPDVLPAGFGGPAAAVPPAPAHPAPAPGAAEADPWALLSGWGAPAASPAPAKVAVAPAAAPTAAPVAAAGGGAAGAAELDFDALFGGAPGADPFEDASWLGGARPPGPTGAPAVVAAPAASGVGPGPAAPVLPQAGVGAAAAAAAAVAGGGASPGGAGSAQAAAAFARGLGLPQAPALDDAAWERVGGAVRLIVSGLIDLLNARAELKRELRVEDRTMLASRDNNPLKTGIDLESALHYLLIAQAGMPGFKPADAALRESVDELRVHELATVAASRAAVEGALRDFDPEVLRKQLAPGKSRLPQLFDSSRMWEAYVERYEKQGGQMADWLEKIFTRHFVPAYSKESERLKMTMAPPPGAGKAR